MAEWTSEIHVGDYDVADEITPKVLSLLDDHGFARMVGRRSAVGTMSRVVMEVVSCCPGVSTRADRHHGATWELWKSAS